MTNDIKTLVDKINGRKSLFFDTNFWIDLTEESDIQHKRIKKLLIKKFEEGKIFCPLYHDTIHELLKQEFQSALKTAEFMNSLNLNLTIKSQNEIFEEEIINFVKNFLKKTQSVLSIHQLYVPILFFINSKNEKINKRTLKNFISDIILNMSKVTIVDLVKNSKDHLPRKIGTKYDVSNTLRKRFEISGKSKDKMKKIEAEYIANKIVIPLLNKHRAKLPKKEQVQFCLYIKSLPRDKYEGVLGSILNYIPAINNYIEIITISGLNLNKKFSINDYHDINMLIVPLTYCDIFVSKDGWIRDLVTNLSDLPNKNNTTFLSNPDQLEKYLIDI